MTKKLTLIIGTEGNEDEEVSVTTLVPDSVAGKMYRHVAPFKLRRKSKKSVAKPTPTATPTPTPPPAPTPTL